MRVYLIKEPRIIREEVSRFLEDEVALGTLPSDVLDDSVLACLEDDATSVVEIAAKLCYMSFGKGRTDLHDFIDNLLSSAHGSVLAHAEFTFIVADVSRSLMYELQRHKVGVGLAEEDWQGEMGISQQSQRYVDETGNRPVMPPAYRLIPALENVWERAMENDQGCYDELRRVHDKILPQEGWDSPRDRRKFINEAARSVLSNSSDTRCVLTANVRAWRTILEQRASHHASEEIRELASLLFPKLREAAPLLFADFEEYEPPQPVKAINWAAKPKYHKV